jgi:trimeric autotransporter adhesin
LRPRGQRWAGTRSGIARTTLVVVIVVLIAVGGFTAFFLSERSSPSPVSTSRARTTSASTSSTLTSSTSTQTSGIASTSTTTATSCINSTTSASYAINSTAGLAWLIGNFSSMTLSFGETAGGFTTNGTIAYNVISSSSTTYKLGETVSATAGTNLSSSKTSYTDNYTLWILKNGTVLAIDQGGNNISSSSYDAPVSALEFETIAQGDVSELIQTPYFHASDTGSVTISGLSISYTDYAANSLPESISSCGNPTTTITQFSLRVGNLSGVQHPLIVSANLDETSDNETSTLQLNLTSLSLA